MNRDELAAFLRTRRARLRPADAGLPDGPRRRTPGLRRQEVAHLDAKYDILAWNELAKSFIGDLSRPGVERNMLRWIFRSPNLREYLCDEARGEFVRSGVADLRAAAGRYPDDASIAALVDELLRTSPEFGELWADHEVEVRRRICKRFEHPEVGPIEIDCQVLLIPDRDQRLVVYATEPGSPSYDAMQRLRLSYSNTAASTGSAQQHAPKTRPQPIRLQTRLRTRL